MQFFNALQKKKKNTIFQNSFMIMVKNEILFMTDEMYQYSKIATGFWTKNLGSTVSCIINDLVFFGRVSPQTELAENGRDEKETRKQESEQGSKEKAKSNPQGMAPGLG